MHVTVATSFICPLPYQYHQWCLQTAIKHLLHQWQVSGCNLPLMDLTTGVGGLEVGDVGGIFGLCTKAAVNFRCPRLQVVSCMNLWGDNFIVVKYVNYMLNVQVLPLSTPLCPSICPHVLHATLHGCGQFNILLFPGHVAWLHQQQVRMAWCSIGLQGQHAVVWQLYVQWQAEARQLEEWLTQAQHHWSRELPDLWAALAAPQCSKFLAEEAGISMVQDMGFVRGVVFASFWRMSMSMSISKKI